MAEYSSNDLKFADLPVSVEDMLAKSRSARLGTVLAHQHLGQLAAA